MNAISRKEKLLLAIAAERETLARQLAPWKRPLGYADRGLEVVRYLRQNPLPLFAAALVVGILRPKKAFRVAKRGFWLWRLYRNARAAWS